RWISAEPLIGPLELEDYLSGDCAPVDYGGAFYEESGPALDWVVVGGESGNGSRPFDLSWARNIVHDCEEAGVACFVKQLGKRPFDTGHDSVGHDSEISHDADVSTKTLEDLLKEYPVKLKSRKGADPGEWEAYLRVRQFPEARAM
ncbi:MAG TPA: DUF5131 family protein, partial [Polyangiaceae bacterium]|nr:DUF5131 family protein [Polyangiaceae bacterium]